MKNKFCTYCGNPLLEDQLVCPECGKAVKTSLKGETIFVSPVEPKKAVTSKKTHKENETQQTEEQPVYYKEELKPEPLPEPESEPEPVVEKLVEVPEPVKSKKLKKVILILTSITGAYLLFLLVWNIYFAFVLYHNEGVYIIPWYLTYILISLSGIVCCVLSFILNKNKIALLILPFISIACALVNDILITGYLSLFTSVGLLATFFISLIPVNIIRFKILKAARQENNYEQSRS